MKRLSLSLILILCPVVLFCQTSAAELMKISSEKILDLESVEYDFRAERYFQSGHFMRNESHVVYKNVKDAERPWYTVKGTKYLSVADKTTSFHFSQAEKDSYLIEYDKRSFEFFSNDMAEVAKLQITAVKVIGSSFNHFHRKEPMNVKSGRVFTLEGEKVYGGEMCFEITTTYENSDWGEFKWYIAKSDTLPRGYVFAEGSNELFYKKVNFNPSQESFILEEPEGYDSKRLTEKNLGDAVVNIREASKSGITYLEGSFLPDWQAKDLDGNIWSSGKLKGKVAVLDFWGMWCAPCVRAMPKVQKLYEAFKEAGVEVIGFDVKDKPEKIGSFLERNGYDYTIIPQAEEIAAQFKVRSYPTIFIIDQQGKVIHAEKGFRSNAYEEWASIITEALKR